MKGGYGAGVTDTDGNIVDPPASLLGYWQLTPPTSKANPRTPARRFNRQSANWARTKASHYAAVPDEQLTDAFHYTLFPNFAVSLWADGFHFLRARPPRPEQCLLTGGAARGIAAELDDGTSATESLTGDGSGDVAVKWLTCGEDSIGPAIEDDVAVFPSSAAFAHEGSKEPISLVRRSASADTMSGSMTISKARSRNPTRAQR